MKGSDRVSPNDIIQIFNRNNYEVQETIEDINELIEQIDNDSNNFTYNLSEALEEWSLQLKKCPLCGANIIKINTNEEHSEYQGQDVSEIINRYGCEDCNYIVD